MLEDIRHRPRFSSVDACRLATKFYDIEGTAEELPSERDQNFRVRCSSGEQFVLKIANSDASGAILDFQDQAMQRIAESAGDFGCPLVRPTTTGERIVTVQQEARHLMWMVTWVPGVPLAEVHPHSPALLSSLGRLLGQTSKSLVGFSHPAAEREIAWDLKHASDIVREQGSKVASSGQQALVAGFTSYYEQAVTPRLAGLRKSVIHSDANDNNIIVEPQATLDRRVNGLIDFGDIVYSCTVYELAACLAYAMLRKSDPLAAAAHVVEAYHDVFPLTETELEVLFPLACMRLCMSVSLSAYQRALVPDNAYLSTSERPAWQLLEQLEGMHPRWAHYVFRHACGLDACPKSSAFIKWSAENCQRWGRVMEPDVTTEETIIVDLSVGGVDSLDDPCQNSNREDWTSAIFRRMNDAHVPFAVGRYNEPRLCYVGEQFQTAGDLAPQRRTIHLGIDLFAQVGVPVFCPCDGLVHSFQDNAAPQDYGPTIIIEHVPEDGGTRFFTLYGHLSRESLSDLQTGQLVKQGERIGTLGDPNVNGDWPPHLHFQVILDMLGHDGDFPGVAAPNDRAIWTSVCPDPNLLLRMPADCSVKPAISADEIVAKRRQRLGKSLSVSYRQPLTIVRGRGQFLYDELGREYLDCVNNVCHVGHCHRHVVSALSRQNTLLNTNTRYLHETIIRYAERLCSTLPDALSVCFFVNSGSEANDLALRLARTYTGGTELIVVDGAYHGNLSSLIDISPYKFDGPGGQGAPPHVHITSMPDGYRGRYRYSDPDRGKKYGQHVHSLLREMHESDRHVAAFICESVLSCAGQIVLPEGYLRQVYGHVRAAGGVCIADEVQVGFGRVGTHFWGFETQGVVPDIVTMGKPIGNGHPLGAVVTTREIAAAFANGMEYFNTYGGNPVSCAIGLAVLETIEDEDLQHHALRVGEAMKTGLASLMLKHAAVGDVRGLGMFLGVELVGDPTTLQPRADIATYVVERAKDHGILLSTDGPLHNVLKIKPPLAFNLRDADRLLRTLDKILAEDPAMSSPCD